LSIKTNSKRKTTRPTARRRIKTNRKERHYDQEQEASTTTKRVQGGTPTLCQEVGTKTAPVELEFTANLCYFFHFAW
jgi:hypothetical protein